MGSLDAYKMLLRMLKKAKLVSLCRANLGDLCAGIQHLKIGVSQALDAVKLDLGDIRRLNEFFFQTDLVYKKMGMINNTIYICYRNSTGFTSPPVVSALSCFAIQFKLVLL